MIPNSPNWSEITDVGQYPSTAFVKPNKPTAKASLSLGPLSIGSSQSKLNSRYWAVYQKGADVVLVGAVGDTWGDEVVLFQESSTIGDIGLTFDQLGRAMVFYQVGNNLYLFWYDPALEVQTITLISTGSSLEAGFDIINNTSDPDSDAMIFYTRSNIIYMRIQRDRWAVEYPEPIFIGDGVTPVSNLELLSSGMRVDNRFQVVYRYKDVGYKPPEVIPPVVEPEPPGGRWEYSLSGYGSKVDLMRNIWESLDDELVVKMDIYKVDLNQDEIVLFSQSARNSYSANGRSGSQLIASIIGENHNVLKLICGGMKTELNLSVILQPGSWVFHFRQHHGIRDLLVQYKAKGQAGFLSKSYDFFMGNIIEPSIPFVFGGDGSESPKKSFRGAMGNMIVETRGRHFFCPLNKKSSMFSDLTPIYAPDGVTELSRARVGDYRDTSWTYKGFT